jgi:D-arabinose 1-dehydrogenase-like Zn-dependent alcohol dehydrogenase
VAAPLLCAGITTYSPLKNHNVGPGKKVAVVGVGGLGHLALQWAKALGADVYALSHQKAKHEDVHQMGITNFVFTEDWEKVTEDYSSAFDFILCANDMSKLPIANFTPLLRPFGKLCIVSLPESDLSFNAFDVGSKVSYLISTWVSFVSAHNHIRTRQSSALTLVPQDR